MNNLLPPRPFSLRTSTLLLASLLLPAAVRPQQTYDPSLPAPEFNEAIDNGTLGYYPVKSFVTQEGLRAPITNFATWTPECDDGKYYFITPRGWGIHDPGPMIMDGRGEMVWGHHFQNTFGGQAYDFLVQEYQGQDYLTFWLGDDRVRGHGSGAYYMLNASYDIVHKVTAAGGEHADLHEFLITDDDTALMTIYEVISGDVTAFRSFDPLEIPESEQNYVWDCAFQEVDIRTGELLFEWRAWEHVSIHETFRDIGIGGHLNDPWDWFHINSIAKDDLGNYLISARYPHSLMYIDGRTSETIWQLGGKENDFADLSGGEALNFAWQHDARFEPVTTFPSFYTPPPEREGYITKLITVFDNAAEDQHYKYGVTNTRGLVLEVTFPVPGTEKALTRTRSKPKSKAEIKAWPEPPEDEFEIFDYNGLKVEHINGTDPSWTVRLIKSYDNPAYFRASSQGSMQTIPQEYGDPRVLLGYGLNAVFAEFDPNGTVLCDVRYGAKTSWERGDIQSYRAYKMAWTGRPEWPPNIEISDDDAEVYVSWNGATDVVEWALQASDTKSDDDGAWSDVKIVPRTGFETTIEVRPDEIGDARLIRVMALAKNRRRLDYGVSEILDRGVVAAYFPTINKQLPPDVAHMPRTKFFLIVVMNVSALIVVYEVIRRVLVWRSGRHGGGALRWRMAKGKPLNGGLLAET